MYIKRTLEPFIAKASQQFPVLLLTGPRQVGKTSLLRHLGGKRTYVTLIYSSWLDTHECDDQRVGQTRIV